MARNESSANLAMADAYGAFSNERARWVQALGESRKPRTVRVQRDPVPVACVLAMVAAVLACVALAGCAVL